MPSWTLADYISNTTKLVGYNTSLSASDVSFWVNQAYRDFVREVPELLQESTFEFSLTSGSSWTYLPDDFYEPISLVAYDSTKTGADGTRLRPLDPAKADEGGYYPVGQPDGYFIYGDRIWFQPSVNSSAATIGTSHWSFIFRYRSFPGDMTNLTDVPSVHTSNRLPILYKAVSYVHDLLNNTEESAAFALKYTNSVVSMKDAIARKQGDRKRTISLPRTGIRRRPGGSIKDQTELWKKV